uniref:Uncharacterized protein n=1 Tax=Trypanosoma vivax (strain Y486) TaxID=1055687 RepID=G0UAX6_TRYVY|nr:hypothetical protein, unlikely [Trypanosoma vivax Y486]
MIKEKRGRRDGKNAYADTCTAHKKQHMERKMLFYLPLFMLLQKESSWKEESWLAFPHLLLVIIRTGMKGGVKLSGNCIASSSRSSTLATSVSVSFVAPVADR